MLEHVYCILTTQQLLHLDVKPALWNITYVKWMSDLGAVHLKQFRNMCNIKQY